MGHTPYRTGLAVAGVAALGGLVWVVMAADPPGGSVPEADVSTSLSPATRSATMPKAIATADRPAIIKVARPTATTRGLSIAPTSLQITVRPEAVERGEPYLVNVYAVPPEKVGAAPEARGPETLVGSFSFFPPPRAGEARTFTLPVPPDVASDLTLKVELAAAAPDAKLEKSTLAVLDAKIATE